MFSLFFLRKELDQHVATMTLYGVIVESVQSDWKRVSKNEKKKRNTKITILSIYPYFCFFFFIFLLLTQIIYDRGWRRISRHLLSPGFLSHCNAVLIEFSNANEKRKKRGEKKSTMNRRISATNFPTVT